MTPSSTHVAVRPWRRARYRIGQFWRGANARVTAEERVRVAQVLPADALALFERMPVDAQRHSLNVLHAVHAAGIRDADLDAAALLHDAGKLAADDGGVRLSLWLRSPLVLLEAVSPRTLARLANADPASGLRYTAYVHQEHPRIGAEWAAAAGCSERACWLIRHHQDEVAGMDLRGTDDAEVRLLKALQAADNLS